MVGYMVSFFIGKMACELISRKIPANLIKKYGKKYFVTLYQNMKNALFGHFSLKILPVFQ